MLLEYLIMDYLLTPPKEKTYQQLVEECTIKPIRKEEKSEAPTQQK